mmetsp:Transcript_4999/g.10776  ORF Transcript_4999/g.10776 Transcript_4999/m.10776 type:complete len:384 (-) Transcript_4999:1138-2289(-)
MPFPLSGRVGKLLFKLLQDRVQLLNGRSFVLEVCVQLDNVVVFLHVNNFGFLERSLKARHPGLECGLVGRKLSGFGLLARHLLLQALNLLLLNTHCLGFEVEAFCPSANGGIVVLHHPGNGSLHVVLLFFHAGLQIIHLQLEALVLPNFVVVAGLGLVQAGGQPVNGVKQLGIFLEQLRVLLLDANFVLPELDVGLHQLLHLCLEGSVLIDQLLEAGEQVLELNGVLGVLGLDTLNCGFQPIVLLLDYLELMPQRSVFLDVFVQHRLFLLELVSDLLDGVLLGGDVLLDRDHPPDVLLVAVHQLVDRGGKPAELPGVVPVLGLEVGHVRIEGLDGLVLGDDFALQRHDLVGVLSHEAVVLLQLVLEEVADGVNGLDAIKHHGL